MKGTTGSRGPTTVGGHAVVLGASMAGLLAARVLSDAYERVTVLDRDVLPAGVQHRKGVPQGRQAHGLLPRGRHVLDELFPGFSAALVSETGGVDVDILADCRWYQGGAALSKARSGLGGLAVSRPYLEARVRQRVAALANVTLLDRTEVLGLVATPDRSRVTGVRLDGDEVLLADLVVDASGRGSRAPRWLDELGYAGPEEEQVRIDGAYACCHFRLPRNVFEGDLFVQSGATPEHPRFGLLMVQEGGAWVCSLFGFAGDHPPADLEGFVDYARGLAVPDVWEAIRDAEPLDEPVRFRFHSSVRRRYERLRRFPQGFLVTGDAVCSFSPTYGQGMTVAAQEALVLRACLAQGDAEDLARRFFREVAKVVDVPWRISVAGDLRFPQAEGERGPDIRLMNAYVARLLPAAWHDPRLSLAFLRVAGLVDAPQRLFRPSVLARVVLGSLRRRPRPAPLPVRPSGDRSPDRVEVGSRSG